MDGGRKGSGVDPIRYLCQRNLVPPHFFITFSHACVLYFGANDFCGDGFCSSFTSMSCLWGVKPKKYIKRVLGSSNTSEAIILLWKRVILKELQSSKQEIDLDRLLSPRLGYICRRCHYAYDKLLKAEDAIRNEAYREYVLKKIGVLVRRELTLMCSERVKSILSSQSPAVLHEFTWDVLLNELSSNDPVFFSILNSCTRTHKPRHNQNTVIGICSALLKFRSPMMNVDQKILSLILYAGHSRKQVFAYCFIFDCHHDSSFSGL